MASERDYRNDPVAFAEDICGFTLQPWQKAALRRMDATYVATVERGTAAEGIALLMAKQAGNA